MVRMRCFLVLVGLLSLGATHASTCTTVASGPFTDVNVWDCSCQLTSCDTLIVSHAISLDMDIDLSVLVLQIESTGSLSGPHEIMLTGELINSGLINIRRLYTQPGFDLRNLGSLVCGVIVSLSDSTFNNGTINCTDSLVNGFNRPFITEGLVNTNVLYALGFYSNSGTTSCSRTTIRNCFNGGSMNIQDTLSTGVLLWNDSIIHAVHLTTAVTIRNHGQIWVEGLLEHGTQGNADSRLEANSTIRTRDFINSAGSEIRGPGQLCIEGHAENHGVLRGSLVICDLSPTMDVPPYLDVNTGTFWISVTYCSNSSCTWTSLSDQASTPAIHITPNPAVDALTIQLGASLPTVHRIEIRDLGGRLVQQLEGPFADHILLHRRGLVAGTYLIRVMRTNGEVPATQMVVFTD